MAKRKPKPKPEVSVSAPGDGLSKRRLTGKSKKADPATTEAGAQTEEGK